MIEQTFSITCDRCDSGYTTNLFYTDAGIAALLGITKWIKEVIVCCPECGNSQAHVAVFRSEKENDKCTI